MSISSPRKSSKHGVEAALAKLQAHSARALERRAVERRAIEAAQWSMPAVNFDFLWQAFLQAGAVPNQVVYWSGLPDWKNQTLTPNPDVIYLFPFIDTREAGPVVIEIPPADAENSITGSIDDAWQCALEDVGPAGADKGKGGKYLILPPDFSAAPPAGYFALPSQTYRSYAILRSNPASGSPADIAKAVTYGKRVRVYPLSQARAPDATVFVDAIDTVYDSTIPYDLRFFRALDRFIQHEPWLMRDKAMIDALRTIGIEKGRDFQPATDIQTILNRAAQEAHALMDMNYEKLFANTFYDHGRWTLPVRPEVVSGLSTFFTDPNVYPTDGRAVLYSMAYFSAKRLGTGQFYLMTLRDRDGAALDGCNAYRLTVPAHPPVNLYWSVTVYDRANHALIRDMKWSSRSSLTPGLLTNPDGSVDVHFAPAPPDGRENNWIPTSPEGRFEALFRFYGPQKALFDKGWILPDIERTENA